VFDYSIDEKFTWFANYMKSGKKRREAFHKAYGLMDDGLHDAGKRGRVKINSTLTKDRLRSNIMMFFEDTLPNSFIVALTKESDLDVIVGVTPKYFICFLIRKLFPLLCTIYHYFLLLMLFA
jgi:hypothetical protein